MWHHYFTLIKDLALHSVCVFSTASYTVSAVTPCLFEALPRLVNGE